MIRTILVANRGEIARRVFATCRRLGIQTVAVYSDADAEAPHAREADRAVHLPGNAPADTYLRGEAIIAAAQAAGADAIHPGYGFLSENADFARQVVEAGLVWIGPEPRTIEAMGSKIRAKELMAESGVPILQVDPESAQPGDFPLLVKASAGGGGRGMRVVETPDALSAELKAAESEAASAFGDGTVFVEPYLPTARHIEVQVMADTHGAVWVVGDRDCSIQRRHQKVVEEAPAPNVSVEIRERLHDAARKAAAAVGYVGAGTVEFLVDRAHEADGRVAFLEMNTRLQVEHPVTECVTGVDLVAAQIAVAEGQPLGEEPGDTSGHAIEVRLYAEDPADDWAPQTGVVRTFEIPGAGEPFAVPTRYGLRLDSAVESGSEVSIHYDPMLAKVIAYGPDRTSAIRQLSDALRRARIHGVATNRDLLRAIVNDDDFAAARVHTALLTDRIDAWSAPVLDDDSVRRYATAAALAQATAAAASSVVNPWAPAAWRNVPSAPRVRKYDVGAAEPVEVAYRSVRERLVPVDGPRALDVSATAVVLDVSGVSERLTVQVGDASVDVDGPAGSLTLTPIPDFIDPADAVAEGSLLSPMPASVSKVVVEPGQRVGKGETVVVVEAMKMQHTIAAPHDGVVSQVDVKAGDQVDADAVLAVIEPEGETG